MVLGISAEEAEDKLGNETRIASPDSREGPQAGVLSETKPWHDCFYVQHYGRLPLEGKLESDVSTCAINRIFFSGKEASKNRAQ